MTKKQGLNEWWAIRSPDGDIWHDTIRKNEKDALISIIKAVFDTQENFNAAGYRAVKVRITEIEEWGE